MIPLWNFSNLKKKSFWIQGETWGNSDTEILKSLEDPERLFKKKDKEKIDFPLFGASSSQDSPNIFDP